VPIEKIGTQVEVLIADHPGRQDSPEYVQTRNWLMGVVSGGCYICGGPVDLSHPEAPADAKGLEDHHGGGILFNSVLVGFNLFPLEWSMGWGADPTRIATFVTQLNEVLKTLGQATYDLPITDTNAVMQYVDSHFNANIKLCAVHHRAVPTQHTPDVNGHEAVGIHCAPWPILAAQAYCDWTRWDMWGGSTGTVAVAPHPSGDGRSVVTHVDSSHPLNLAVGQELPASHPHSRSAHAGYSR
jgi:hypothetical protein